MADAAVRETDNDAAVSRLSAAKAGYLEDAFAGFFVKRPQSRPPLINIGTFVRTWAIDQLVYQFLDADNGSKKQIVSLGAGTDTRYFRLMGTPRAPAIAKYVEVDFAEATTKKAMVIKKQNKLAELLGQDVRLEQGGTSLISSVYCLIPGDLRNFDESIAPKLLELLNPNMPTLFLAECCFIYLDPSHSSKILRWTCENFGEAGTMAVLYDPVGLDDNFGRVMINNLQARGLQLLGASANMSLDAQVQRLQEHGFDTAFAKRVKTIRKDSLSVSEQERLTKLEMLDEIEELDLLTAHYSVSWAIKDSPSASFFQNIGI